jgi:hypothetical protein
MCLFTRAGRWCALPVLQLETAATAGVVLVLGLIVLLAVDAINSRFPAIQDGSLPLWSLKVDGHLPEAFSVVGYAFYMQVSLARLLADSGLHARLNPALMKARGSLLWLATVRGLARHTQHVWFVLSIDSIAPGACMEAGTPLVANLCQHSVTHSMLV